MPRVAVIGATGFVGSAVCDALEIRGHSVVRLKAPRIPISTGETNSNPELARIRTELGRCTSLVNAAGASEATATSRDELMAANGILPGVIAQVCADQGLRFIHVSSAAVQGRSKVLDASPMVSPFSAYSESKVRGEAAALQFGQSCVYRPPGVHGANRAVTRSVARLARSPLSSVAGDGNRNTPQSLIGNVADAIAFLATCSLDPPPTVSHPSEGLTTGTLLEALGDKTPAHIPDPVARGLISAAFAASNRLPRLAGHARRLEVLWLGQQQAQSWLTSAGWSPIHSKEAWHDLGRKLAREQERKDIG